MKRLYVPLLGAAITALAAGPVVANEIEEAIKARQGFMRVNGFYMSILGDMAKGKRPYDAELASTAANNIATLSNLKNGAMWPTNSDKEQPGLEDKTRAKPEIWSTWPEVANRNKDWGKAATEFAKVAGNGLEALRAGIKNAGDGCKGCHEDFRAKKEE